MNKYAEYLINARKSKYDTDKKKGIKKVYICVTVIFLLAVSANLIVNGDVHNNTISSIKRPEPGEEPLDVAIDVYDEHGKKQTTINANIEPRKLSQDEVQIYFDNAYEELLMMMLKDNTSMDCITQNICIPDTLADGIINVSLYPSDYSVIDYDGTVYNEKMTRGEMKETVVTYVMQYEEYNRQGEIGLVVRPIGTVPGDEGQERVLDNDDLGSVLSGKSGQNTVQKVVDNTVNEDTDMSDAMLPETIADRNVYYRYTKEKQPWIAYIVLIVAVIALVVYRRKNEDIKKQKQRIKELQYDYSEIIAKLTLLLGAGMTIRKAWQKMVSDYVRKREMGGDVKTAYEEMYITDCNIKAGISEYEAYEEFGHRCNTREYLKLASLLQTNLKRGTNRLRELLYQESYDAFEQRKNYARQKGEEATTRLLIPMIMMLIVVMVIVMIPAVMSFYMT